MAFHEILTAEEGGPMRYLAVTPTKFIFAKEIGFRTAGGWSTTHSKEPLFPSGSVTGYLPIDEVEIALQAMSRPLPVLSMQIERYRGTGLETFPSFLN